MNHAPHQHIDRLAARHITRLAVLSAFVDTAVAFGGLGWLYVVLIAVSYPDELSVPIASRIPIQRDTLEIICFGVSAVAYFIREAGKHSGKSGDLSTSRLSWMTHVRALDNVHCDVLSVPGGG
jgi:hypothetical protein